MKFETNLIKEVEGASVEQRAMKVAGNNHWGAFVEPCRIGWGVRSVEIVRCGVGVAPAARSKLMVLTGHRESIWRAGTGRDYLKTMSASRIATGCSQSLGAAEPPVIALLHHLRGERKEGLWLESRVPTFLHHFFAPLFCVGFWDLLHGEKRDIFCSICHMSYTILHITYIIYHIPYYSICHVSYTIDII
jgi:hypothetical protein